MVADGGAMTSLCKAFSFVWQPESSTYRHTALPALLSLFASECVMTGEARVSTTAFGLGTGRTVQGGWSQWKRGV